MALWTVTNLTAQLFIICSHAEKGAFPDQLAELDAKASPCFVSIQMVTTVAVVSNTVRKVFELSTAHILINL